VEDDELCEAGSPRGHPEGLQFSEIQNVAVSRPGVMVIESQK
jgi:hypothetical protein